MRRQLAAGWVLLTTFAAVMLFTEGCALRHVAIELKNPKVATVVGLDIAAAWAAQHEANVCRARNGIAPCPGGYGPIRARAAITWGMAGLMGGLSVWGHHEGYPEWAAPALIVTGMNTATAIEAGIKGCPRGYHFLWGTKSTCVDNDDHYDRDLFRNKF